MKNKNLLNFLGMKSWLALVLVFVSLTQTFAQTHPFLIVKENQYASIRAKYKSGKQPFASIGKIAFKRWNNNYDATNRGKISEMLSYNIVAYILEENTSNKTRYKNKMLGLISAWGKIAPNTGGGHGKYIGGTGTQIYSIIALDIIHNSLNARELKEAEANIKKGADFYLANLSNWRLSSYGVNLVYAIYKNNTAEINKWKNLYDGYLFDKSMTNDNSWGQSSGYVFARMHGGRISKNITLDILHFTGRGNYYGDKRLKELYQWSTTFALTPFNSYTKFGDTGLMRVNFRKFSNPYYADKWGPYAGSLMYWHIGGANPRSFEPTNLFVLLHANTTRPTPVMPRSLLKKQSGAALWGRTDSPEALQGVLYCLKRDNPTTNNFGHALSDVNSFDISAYGEHLLMNSGVRYTTADGQTGNYPGFAPDGGRWNRASLHNTVLIGNKTNHDQQDGGGLTDGIAGGSIEFGTTEAGPAIKNGTHKRNLHLVHPSSRSHGYFIVHDEVKPDNSNDKVAINFQVNATYGTTNTITANQEYNAAINGARLNTSNTSENVSLFFTSGPRVNIVKSYKGGFDFDKNKYPLNAFESDNVKAEYRAASDGYVRATTIIFPEDNTHAKPTIEKISAANYNGAKLIHRVNYFDYYIGASPTVENTYNGVTFKASTTFYRQWGGFTILYSVTNGSKLMIGKDGFSANNPISIVMEKDKGTVHLKKGTQVTFFKEDLSQVKIDGKIVPPLSSYAGAVKVSIPAGKHTIELMSVKPICTTGNWNRLSGAALDVGINGAHKFVIGTNGLLYKSNGRGGFALRSREIAIKRLDVAANGNVWAIASDNKVYEYNGSAWANRNTTAMDVGVSNSSVYIVGLDNKVRKYLGNNRWGGPLPGAAIRIDVAGNDGIWIRGTNNLLYHWRGNAWVKWTNSSLVKVRDVSVQPDASQAVIIGDDGSAYYVKAQNQLTKFSSGSGLTHISMNQNGRPWAINTNKQVYEWGCSLGTRVVGLAEKTPLSETVIYPNPVIGDVLNVQINEPSSLRSISIVDARGKVVWNNTPKQYNRVISIDVSQLKKGLYFLKISSDTKEVTRRFIK